MANKSIKELPKATQIQEDDALPMQQGTVTKQVTGLTLTLWLLGMADGHGGVKDFKKLSESGLEKTYQFTMADTTTYTFTVTDGNGVADFQHSVSGLVHTYKLIMDNGQEYTMTIKDGEKGDKGDAAYLWYKFASEKPTSSGSSMGDEPDAWMGVHSGHEATAPTDPMDYTWVRVLGNTGRTGDPATLVRSAVEYQVSTSGTVVPSGNWSESIPAVPQGSYLWTRTTIQFNTGGIIQFYSNGRNGLDGLGSVVSVNNVSPGENGNVELTADDVGAVPKTGGTMQGPLNMNGKKLSGLNNPTEPDQVAPKSYVDQKLPLSGGTMTGPLNVLDPTEDQHAASKGYVDRANPYNCLDNSNFREFLAQAGIGGNHGTQAYAGDRWMLVSGEVSGDKNENGNGYTNITLNGTIRQRVANPPEIGSAFVAMVSGTATIDYDGTYVTLTSAGGVIDHVELYEGVYTEDNRPTYRRREYATEFLSCLRYYLYRVAQFIAGINSTNSRASFKVNFPVPMRINPTISHHGSPWVYTSNNGAYAATNFSFSSTERDATFSCASNFSTYFACVITDITLEFIADIE